MTPASELMPLLYSELRRLARSRLASGSRPTLLDTTALVHESFLRLQKAGHVQIKDQEHFMAYAATTMRSIVVDHVRRRCADRRGGGAARVTLDTALGDQIGDPQGASDAEILEVGEALEALATIDARLVQVVEMRYFAGLTDEQVGAALGISDRTVRRDWERARLLLAGLIQR